MNCSQNQTNGRIFKTNTLALITLSHNTLRFHACCNLQQAWNLNILSVKHLTATGLIPRILHKEVIGSQLCRRNREDEPVSRERLAGK